MLCELFTNKYVGLKGLKDFLFNGFALFTQIYDFVLVAARKMLLKVGRNELSAELVERNEVPKYVHQTN